MIDLAAVKAAKATDRRALAILAHDNATAEPDGANWRAVADMLRLAVPSSKAAPKIPAAGLDPRFAPWADYDIPQSVSAKRLGRSPVLVVTFEGGEVVRCPAVSMPGKPVNIGRGLRVAFAFYQCRIANRAGELSQWSSCVNVPAFLSVICETNETEYDAADCNARSAGWRLGTFDAEAVKAESLAYPERTDDGTLDRAEFVKASYRLAVARLRQAALPEGEDSRELTYAVERCSLLLAGWSMLQIKAKWRADDEAARKAAPVATDSVPVAPSEYLTADKADGTAWLAARRETRHRILVDAGADMERATRLAYAVMTFWPDLIDAECSVDAPASAACPVAPSRAAPFLASSSLGAVRPSLPVTPSRVPACILRVVA